MKKEEFLAMSLTYGLIISQNGYQYQLTSQVYKLNNRGIWNVKPICRPLSDLTKPIEHNGETFVPIVYLAKMRSAYLHESDFDRYYGKLKMDISTKRLPFDMFQKLVEWKFNLMDESEEFIDVNTLQENPYK